MKANFDSQLFEWFRQAGFKTYLVGNKVRALLLGKADDPKDFDVATSATPLEMVKIFKRHHLLPASMDEKFGVATLKREGALYEFATFREDIYTERDLEMHRRYPSQVRFVRDVKRDSLRRDFTVNAIYFDVLTSRFIDPLGGLEDWKKRIIRVVGKPSLRFQEDPLRILRAVRFKNVLGFHYHPETQRALRDWAHLVKYLNFSIKQKELKKLQDLDRWPKARKELSSLGILPRI